MTDATPTAPTADATPHLPTLMTVHAHPDDETIGTGGTMAKAVAEGRRVILVTCTRGEMGEIRAGELERAMAHLGVTEWENLGYHDSDMMGRPGNVDPRCFWQADLDEAAGRLVWLIRRSQPDVVTTYNDFGGYGHPDHIRTHDVAVRAFDRAGDAAWYPSQLAPEHGGTGPALDAGGLAPWTPSKLYEQAIPASVRTAMREAMETQGKPSPWAPPDDATPEQLAEFEAQMARMLVPDDAITTWIDIAGEPVDRKWAAIQEHVTQIAMDSTFMTFGQDGWRKHWSKEAYIVRRSTVPIERPESDLFAGLV